MFKFDNTYAKLPGIFYRNQKPEVFPKSEIVIFNERLAAELGLETEIPPETLTGSMLPNGAKPISQAYAGYQFGYFTMLGDGRAVLLGEQITPDGRRYDIQLKGSGLTPFSRNGDGYAALLPMLREYIISEALHSLGIPTTRSLAVALTGKDVIREKILQGAVLTRVASSHIRVGTFNYIAAFGTFAHLQTLADYAIARHFPEIKNDEEKYVLFLRKVSELQASLIAKWQCAGFIHGVMNTDNMAISGETIDYGPCAFMDTYDPNTVFSSIDTDGRYAYKNQPAMGAWNLSRFAESLLPLLSENENEAVALAEKEIALYWERFDSNWLSDMREKLSIVNEETEDIVLVNELLNLMFNYKLDFTNTFRLLSTDDFPFPEWKQKWNERLTRQPKQNITANNPAVIPRNHRVEEALSAAENGDYSVMNNLLNALNNPFKENEKYAQPPETKCKYKTFCGT